MKNLKLVALIALFISAFSVHMIFGQSRWNTKSSNSIDLVFAGDLGFRLMNDSDPLFETQLRNRRAAESFKFNYKAGLNFNIGLTNRLLVKTGIRFANPGYSISTVEKIDFTQNINEVEKMALMQRDEEGFRYKVHHNLLQVPIGIKYVAVGGFCEPYFELGIMPSFYGTTSVSEFDFNDVKTDIKIEENINKVNFISFISVGGNYRASDNLSIFTQIAANYQLNNLRIDAANEKLVSLGLEIGVRQYL